MYSLTKSKTLLAVLIVAVVAAATVTYTNTAHPKAPQYRTEAIEKGDIEQTVSANGTINPVTMVSVGTQVSGTVKKLYVDYNTSVKKGQVLLELDDSLLSAQQKQSQANVRNAEASLELASANEARMRDLYAQDYVSRQELDSAVQARKSAEAQLQLAEASVEKDRANLANAVIRSPVSGVVIDRSVDVGQTVAASLQTPTLFKIAQDLARMQIDASFAEADIGNIRVGQRVRFTVDAFPDQNFNGSVKLVRMNPTTQQNVVTYDVVINVDNPELKLLPGMTAYVTVIVAERKDVLKVPLGALRYKPTNTTSIKSSGKKPQGERSGDGRMNGTPSGRRKHEGFAGKVYLLEDGKLKVADVSLGIADSRYTEVRSGLIKAGDEVVVGEVQETSDSAKSAPMRMRMF
jgi:HlyD family secretion protein